MNVKIIQSIFMNRRSFHRWVAPTLKTLKKRKDQMGPQPPTHRNSYLEWNYDAELYAFGKRLGEEFDREHLKQALTERSYIIREENKQRAVGIEPELVLEDNNEFVKVGEQLISNYIKKYLTTTLPRLPHKYILKIHDHLISEDVLANVSKHIGIDDLILSADFPLQSEVLARGLKSVTQALRLSSGADRANAFVRDLVLTQLTEKDLTPFCTPEDPLKALKEVLDKEKRSEPEPRLIGEAGRNTLLAVYQVGIYVDKKIIGSGFGESIEVAKDMAACDALWRRWGITLRRKPFTFSLEFPPS